jgi:xylose dehydrogenase (NAD/NADP)
VADQLRWGILGAAGIAKIAVIPAIAASRNGRLVAVASRDPSRTRQSLADAAVPRFVQGYEALLDDPDIDAVYIPLPNHLHAEWAMRAADAGKAVLVEKPIGLNEPEAQQVIAHCAARGVPVMEGFMYGFHPQHKRVRQLIAEGAIGEVREVRAHLSVDLMSGGDTANVRFKPEWGGGTLLDMGCYTSEITRMIFGDEPRAVRAWWDIDPTLGIDLTVAAILDFGAGRIGTMSASFQANAQGRYEVVGTKGIIEVPRGIIPGLTTRVSETLIVVMDPDGRRREETLPAVDHYRLMVEEFSDAVLTGAPVPRPPERSVGNMRVLDAIARSAREGTEVLVGRPPQSSGA